MSSDEKPTELPRKPTEKPTLHSFIEENHKLITVLGVFTALTVFAANLSLKPMGLVLSFLFMSLTGILWFELLGRFPSKAASWRIAWFENILTLTVLALFAYWLLDFRGIWKTLLVVLVFGFLLHGVSVVLKRFDAFDRIFRARPGEKRSIRYALWLLIAVGALVAVSALAAFLTPWINRLLDAAAASLNSP